MGPIETYEDLARALSLAKPLSDHGFLRRLQAQMDFIALVQRTLYLQRVARGYLHRYASRNHPLTQGQHPDSFFWRLTCCVFVTLEQPPAFLTASVSDPSATAV